MSQNDLDALEQENIEWAKRNQKLREEHEADVTEYFDKIEKHLSEKVILSKVLDDKTNQIIKWSSMFGGMIGLMKAGCNNKELFRLLKKELEYLQL